MEAPECRKTTFTNRGLKIIELTPFLAQRAKPAGGFIRRLNNSVGQESMSRIQIVFIALCMSALAGCTTAPDNSQRLVRLSSPSSGVDVYFIPFLVEDVTVYRLAEHAKQDLGIEVKAIIAMGSRELLPAMPPRGYDPRQIADAVKKLKPSLLDRKKDTHFVVLTDRDLVDMERGGRPVFSQHYHEDRISVVSSSGMAEDALSSGQPRARYYKMIKRAIGEIYYGYKRSTEPTDLMYSPIQSVRDIDRLRDGFTN